MIAFTFTVEPSDEEALPLEALSEWAAVHLIRVENVGVGAFLASSEVGDDLTENARGMVSGWLATAGVSATVGPLERF